MPRTIRLSLFLKSFFNARNKRLWQYNRYLAMKNILPVIALTIPLSYAQADICKKLNQRLWDYVSAKYKQTDEMAHPRELLSEERLTGPRVFTDHGLQHPLDILEIAHESVDRVSKPLRWNADQVARAKSILDLQVPMHDIVAGGDLRKIHPEVASLDAFSPAFDSVLDDIWKANPPSKIVQDLKTLHSSGKLKQDPKLVLREIISMSNTHSKSRVPREYLQYENIQKLRDTMIRTVSNPVQFHLLNEQISALQKKKKTNPDLASTYQTQIDQLEKEKLSLKKNQDFERFYQDANTEPFAWLKDPDMASFNRDFLLTEKILSVADASRQRSTATRTSGGHQAVHDLDTGEAYLLIEDPNTREMIAMKSTDALHSGESNIFSSAFDNDSVNYRVVLNHGAYPNADAYNRSVKNTGIAVKDIAGDALIFGDNQKLIIEAPVVLKKDARGTWVNDPQVGLDFATAVAESVRSAHPGKKIDVVESSDEAIARAINIKNGIRREQLIYNQAIGGPTFWEKAIATQGLLARQGLANSKSIEEALRSAKVLTLKKGDKLLSQGSGGDFVYIALDNGFRIKPKEYSHTIPSFATKPGMIVGDAGVLRGGERNADVYVARDTAQVLMIPSKVYKEHLLEAHSPAKVAAELQRRYNGAAITVNGQRVPVFFVGVDESTSLLNLGQKVTALDVPLAARRGLTVIDHHGPYRNPKQPYLNTSVKIINKYNEFRKNSSHAEAVNKLYQWAFGIKDGEKVDRVNITSDNVFDTDLSAGILLNPSLLEHAETRSMLKQMAYFQDFGVFGPTDGVGTNATNKMKALLQAGDAIINRHKDTMAAGDRLKPSVNNSSFHQIFSSLADQVKEIVTESPEESAHRAKSFDEQVKKMVVEIQNNSLVPDSNGNSQIAVFDGNKLDDSKGVATTWRARSMAHNKPFQAQVTTLANGKTAFIISVPEGVKEASLNSEQVARIYELIPEAERSLVVQRDPRLLFCFAGVSVDKNTLMTRLQSIFSR